MQIQCLSGPATTAVGNDNYVFARDGHGRYVANVQNLKHAAILCGLSIYQEAADLGPVVVSPADPAAFQELEDRCNQLVRDLATAEANLSTANSLLADERETVAGLRRQIAIMAATPPERTSAPAAVPNQQDETLLGSDAQPSYIEVGETSYPLGDVVAKSHDESGLTVEAWNALTQPERESRIAATIELMRTPPQADKLQDISGIGDPAAAKLIAAGITTFKQIAEMSPENLLKLDKSLGLKGISERSGWRDQAIALVKQAETDGNK